MVIQSFNTFGQNMHNNISKCIPLRTILGPIHVIIQTVKISVIY